MDARPQRLRAVSRVTNENAPPATLNAKTLHHNRTKSTPNFGLMKNPVKTNANAGNAIGNGRQRTAFGDVSNTFRSTANGPTAKDDLSILKEGGIKLVNKPSSTLQPLKETSVTSVPQGNKQPALLRPAQRPLNAVLSKQPTIAQPTTSAFGLLAAPNVTAQQANRSSDPEQLLNYLNRKRTTIFREQAQPVEQETVAPAKETTRPIASTAPVHQILEPPKEKKLPALPAPEPLLHELPQPPEPRDAYEQEVKDFSRDLIQSIEQTFARAEQAVSVKEEVEVEVLPVVTRTSSAEVIPLVEPTRQPTDEEIYQLALETQLPPLDAALGGVELGGSSIKVPLSASADYPEYFDEDDEEYYDAEGYTTARSIRSRGDNTTGGLTTFLEPRVTNRVLKELEQARDYVLANRTEDDIEDEAWDTSMVAEYGDDIFEYMRKLENKMRPNEHYMDNQNEIQWSMRSVLMDWMIQVHGRFGLLPETLFLAVNYIDRFLSCKVVSLGKLQLVGATALFVAAKYEEINCPSVQEIVYMVDNAYTIDEILKAERFMLSMLQFELGWPGPMSFLRRISKADEYDLDTRTMAKYFLEVMIMDERFVACAPSFASAGAHCLSRLVLDKGDWTLSHTHYAQYTYWQLYDLVAKLVECCQQPRTHHQAVFEKYQEKKYKRCALTVEAKLTSPSFKLPSRNSGRESSTSSSWQSALWRRF